MDTGLRISSLEPEGEAVSRSGYYEMDSIDSPEEQWALLRWHGAVWGPLKRGRKHLKRGLSSYISMSGRGRKT